MDLTEAARQAIFTLTLEVHQLRSRVAQLEQELQGKEGEDEPVQNSG
jgi:hypothetical protein